MYDEIEYWRKRKFPNSKESRKTLSLKNIPKLYFLSYIEKHLQKCSKILDFGPGVGRTFSAYTKISHLECFDITDKHLQTLIDVSKRYPFTFSFTLGHVVGVTPYRNKEFDAVVTCQVLLHQRPEHIYKVMNELMRISNKVIVVSGYNKNKKQAITKDSYCFIHDYLKICQNNNWGVFDVNYDDKLIYFVMKENEAKKSHILG